MKKVYYIKLIIILFFLGYTYIIQKGYLLKKFNSEVSKNNIVKLFNSSINHSLYNDNSTKNNNDISNININKTNAKENLININNIYREDFFMKSKNDSHINTYQNFNKTDEKFNIQNIRIANLSDLIANLNFYSDLREPKFILIFDYIYSEYCNDFNGYFLFEYYLKNNATDVYYFINNNSKLYISQLKHNQTENIIPINPKVNIYKDLFYYLLNSKIIIQSYTFYDFQTMVSYVPYLKYLHINHGIRYFKTKMEELDFYYLIRSKRNVISTSPFEYQLLIKYNNSENYIHKAGLTKYDRFAFIKKNESEKDCILISFTYRSYDNETFEKSLLKKNFKSLLNNNTLISILKNKNIDLIYIPHHHDLFLNKSFDENQLKYAKFYDNSYLTHYIEQCSLLVTDFSSISFDFMFQNKPVLFYLIDANDTLDFPEKNYMENKNNSIFFGNGFTQENEVIEKINYYIERKFDIGEKMKQNYNSVFFYKNNIRKRIVEIVNKIIND